MSNQKHEPTYEEWENEHRDEVEAEYKMICDEYGDLAPFESDYLYQKYEEFLEELKTN